MAGKLRIAAVLLGGLAAHSALADEMCALKVRNGDLYSRSVDHLLVAPNDGSATPDFITINRIVPPQPGNAKPIHWNCGSHDRPYRIIGLDPAGQEIVEGVATPATSDIPIDDQPTIDLTIKAE